MWTTILILALLALLGFALFTQYSKTPTTESKARRVWLSLVAAAGVIGAAIMKAFEGGVSP